MNITCIKCKYVLDLDEYPDTGECPKCQGMMHQDGEAYENYVHKHLVDLYSDIVLRSRISKGQKPDSN